MERLNTEITRIFHLKPEVSIVYVSPIAMSEETVNYYYKILELGEVEGFRERVRFVECERNGYFDGETLNRRLYYSSRTLREIKGLIKGGQAVVVPGEMCEAAWYVVAALGTPSMCSFRSYEYNKRSAPLHLFRTLDVPSVTFWKIDPTPTG